MELLDSPAAIVRACLFPHRSQLTREQALVIEGFRHRLQTAFDEGGVGGQHWLDGRSHRRVVAAAAEQSEEGSV